jgi:hypothetical protein
MTQPMSARLRCAALAATAIFFGVGATAHAQELRREAANVEPWHTPDHAPPPPHATSSLDATKAPVATPEQQRETRTLATAVFARPAAGQRAADKAAEAYAPPIPPAEPKAEWLADEGVHLRGKGLELSAPF